MNWSTSAATAAAARAISTTKSMSDSIREIDEQMQRLKNVSSGYYISPMFCDSKMFSDNITDINIIVPNKVVEVTFADGTKEKAVCQAPDVFNLERAISICIAKKILGGSSKYNKAVKDGMKVYENKILKQKAEKEEQEHIEKKKAKRIAAKKRRLARLAEEETARLQAEREEMISIQKEAYVRAMKELEKGNDV